MGAILALAGIRDVAILEFGPMGTANYGDMMLGSYGCDQGALHFATHIDETQIALGDSEVLEDAIKSIRNNYAPRAILVVPSAIAEITGADIEYVCHQETSAACPVLLLPAMGIGKEESYGVEAAFGVVSKLVGDGVDAAADGERTFNIVGCVPNDYSAPSDTVEIIRIMKAYFRAEPLCVMPWGASFDSLQGMNAASVNLVIRHEAGSFARSLSGRFGTPFVQGRPCGFSQTEAWLRVVSEVTGWELDEAMLQKDRLRCAMHRERLAAYVARAFRGRRVDVVIKGGNYMADSLGKFLKDELDMNALVISKTEGGDGAPVRDEATWRQLIEG